MIDINNKENIRKIQKLIEEEFNKKYEEVALREVVRRLKDEPLYSLNNIFENISAGLYNTKEGKKCIAKYVKTIKENASLLNAYAIMSNINHMHGVKSANVFINEVASLSNNIDKSEYLKGKKMLSDIIGKCINESKSTSDTILGIMKNSHTALNESINYIIESKKNISNIPEYSNSIAVILENVKPNDKLNETSTDGKTMKELMAEINESAEGYTAEECNAIKEIALSTISGKSEKEIYESFKDRCLNLLSETVKADISVEDKARFQKMIEQINGRQYKHDTLNEDVLNFARLYETLKES